MNCNKIQTKSHEIMKQYKFKNKIHFILGVEISKFDFFFKNRR